MELMSVSVAISRGSLDQAREGMGKVMHRPYPRWHRLIWTAFGRDGGGRRKGLRRLAAWLMQGCRERQLMPAHRTGS